jgi:hypothetical protein
MNWWLIGFGAVFALIAGFCFWYRSRKAQELALMAATETSNAVDVAKLAPGSIVEVKGNLRCQSPLTAEFSKKPCIYFKAQIDREEVYYTKDSQGRSERKTRTHTVHSNIKYSPCVVEDAGGWVAVSLEGADIEGEQVVNRRETEQRGVAGAILSIAAGSGGATLIHTETILAPDIPIYVLGEVQPDHSIGKPAEKSKNRIFVVSNKSEEERSKSITRTMLWLLIGAVVCGAIGLALLGFGVVTPL